MMMVMIVSLRSDPVHLQLTGKRPLVGTRGGLGRDATPPLLTVRAGGVGAAAGTSTTVGTSRAGGGDDIYWDDIQEE
jgi:hypothetical protein